MSADTASTGRAIWRLTVVLAVLAAWAAVPARAADVFTIARVAVDVSDRTASAARDIALRLGQRRALGRLFARLTLRAWRGRLPQLTDPEITSLVAGFEVARERNSATRYIAELTYHFKEEDVAALLRLYNVPFTATPAKPVLVLPIYGSGGRTVLWDDPNPWRDAWARRRETDGLMQIIVPLGDLKDLAAIDVTRALAEDELAIAEIARRYRVNETLIAVARRELDFVSGRQLLRATLKRVGPFGTRVVIEDFVVLAGEGPDAMLERVADEIALRVEEEWKAMTLLDFSSEARLSARVPLTVLDDWLVVRRRLADNAQVRDVALLSLSVRDAQVRVSFLGNARQLAMSLAQSDLDLSYEDGYWVLDLRSNILPGEKNVPLPLDAVERTILGPDGKPVAGEPVPVQPVRRAGPADRGA